MSIMTFNKKYVGWLWGIDYLLLVLMLLASTLNDSNGRYPGLGETSSLAIFISIVVLGLGVDGLVIVVDKIWRRRVMAIAIVLLYLLMLLPAFAWW